MCQDLFSRHLGHAGAMPDGEENTRLIAAPNDKENTCWVDLNKDGKQDIVMHHPFSTKCSRSPESAAGKPATSVEDADPMVRNFGLDVQTESALGSSPFS